MSSWEPLSPLHQKSRFPHFEGAIPLPLGYLSMTILANTLASSLSPAGSFPCHSLLQPLQSHFFECGHVKVEHTVQLAAANYLTCREVNSSCISYSIITLLFIQGKPCIAPIFSLIITLPRNPSQGGRLSGYNFPAGITCPPYSPPLNHIKTLLLTEFTSGSKPL